MSYELNVVNAFNTLFNNNNINAVAYRLKQARFCTQICDIVVDSCNPSYYLAIECKTTKYGLFFSSNFSNNQVEQITEFIKKSGRFGILALRDRKEDYLIPWSLVLENYTTHKKGVPKTQCAEYKVDYKRIDSIIDVLVKINSL